VLKVELDMEQLQQVVADAVNSAVKSALENQVFSKLPPLLTRTQLMEMFDIGATKASELLGREDFPVLREFGHPRIPTHLLMQWIEKHTDWIDSNAGEKWSYNYKNGVA